jgi:hypothetical protein
VYYSGDRFQKRRERERRLREEEEGDLMGGAHMSVWGKRDQGYQFGFELGGPWAACGTGPIRIPRALSHFYFLFFFFFFCFSKILSYYLQKFFKSIQTTFRNFLKINAMI